MTLYNRWERREITPENEIESMLQDLKFELEAAMKRYCNKICPRIGFEGPRDRTHNALHKRLRKDMR
jgi:hypothetical protein